jgi:hypothetical protein
MSGLQLDQQGDNRGTKHSATNNKCSILLNKFKAAAQAWSERFDGTKIVLMTDDLHAKNGTVTTKAAPNETMLPSQIGST